MTFHLCPVLFACQYFVYFSAFNNFSVYIGIATSLQYIDAFFFFKTSEVTLIAKFLPLMFSITLFLIDLLEITQVYCAS